LPHGQLRVADLVIGSEVQAVYRYGDTLLLIRQNSVRAHSLSDGRLLGQELNPHRWVQGRFFRGTNHFYFAVWDGERVKFEPVSMPSRYLPASVAAVFDRDGLPGPWLLCKSGEVVSTESGQIIKLPQPTKALLNFNQPRISKDGHQLLVQSTQKDEQNHRLLGCLIDLEDWPKSGAFRYSDTIPEHTPPFPTWNIYRVIESVMAIGNQIALCGRKSRWRKLAPDHNGRLRITSLTPSGVVPQPMFGQPKKTNHGCQLQVAEMENGGNLFLDCRGLLHFKSSSPDLPEVSIVLADGEVAGWTSDGLVCGPAFF